VFRVIFHNIEGKLHLFRAATKVGINV